MKKPAWVNGRNLILGTAFLILVVPTGAIAVLAFVNAVMAQPQF